MELDHQSTCCQGVPAESEDQHGSMYLTTKMAVEGVVTPAEWTQLEDVVQHLTPAGTREECEALVCAVAQLIHLGRQRLEPGGVRQRRPLQVGRVEGEVVQETFPNAAPAQIIAVSQPFMPNLRCRRFSMRH